MNEHGKGDVQNLKRRNDGTSYDTTPSQRRKPNGIWRAWETQTEDTPSTAEYVAQDSLHPQEHPPTVVDEHQTPVPQSTYFAVIRDALEANPGGMTTQQIMEWFEDNRPEVFKPRGKEKFKASMQSTLSAQSRKKQPILWKYEDEGGGSGSRSIWRLHDSTQCVEVDEGTHRSRASTTPANEPGTASDGHDAQSLPVSRREVSHDLQESTPTHSGCSGGPAVVDISISRVTPTRNGQEHQVLSNSPLVQHELAVAVSDPHAVHINPSERNVSADGGSESEHLRLGQSVVQMRSLKRTSSILVTQLNSSLEFLPDMDALKHQVDEKSELAQQLAIQAAEARTQVEACRQDLEQGQVMWNEFSKKKMEIERIEKELREIRALLDID